MSAKDENKFNIAFLCDCYQEVSKFNDKLNPSSIEPTPVEPTPIEPTPIEPTPIDSTNIQPTEIKSGKFHKAFSMKTIYSNFGLALLGSVLIGLGFGLQITNAWIGGILGLVIVSFAIGGLIQEILKLPISPEFIASLNSKLAPNQSPIDIQKINPFRKIIYRLQSAKGSVRVIPPVAVGVSVVAAIISLSTSLGSGIALFNTSITGRWEHEIGSIPGDSTFVTNVTMWALSGEEDGMIYMNVVEDGTFTIEYETTIVSYGEWHQEDNEYKFLHHDPEEVLASLWENYRIRGNHLYVYGGQYNYFVKV